jgi:cytochrome c peroxidase
LFKIATVAVCAGFLFLSDRPDAALAAEPSRLLSGEPIQPLSMPAGLDQRKVALGKNLFFDPILSADGTVSCVTCHDLSKGGSDHRARSIGIKGGRGGIRAPSVYNCAVNFMQFWDGRAASLEAQAAGPITNPLEMGSVWPDVIAKLSAAPAYSAAFKTIYASQPNAQSVTDAIATFERTLISVNSRFDAYLRGDDTALSEDERKGYELFKSYGCASCHQGANVGGNMFEKFGFLGDYFTDRGHLTPADLGRFNVTGREADRNVFKVPSLRMVGAGGPYFHDGSIADLPTAVEIMGRYQLGRDLPKADVQRLVQFLNSLLGDTYQERP